MKKFYLLALLSCLSLASFGQTATATIWATGATGSYITGSSTATTRTDGNIVDGGSTTPSRGYAVFNLASAGIPAGSVIGSVVIGYYVSGYTAGTITCSTNIYPGNLSLVTTAVSLFPDMVPTPATNVSTVAYTGITGNHTVASTAAADTMIVHNLSGDISVCFAEAATATSVFTIIGETGVTTSITAADHAPYIQITYCPPPTGVTATAAPNPICAGSTLTLTGTATGASGGYSWIGPGAYSSSLLSTTLNTPATGVYTLTAYNSCTTYSASATAYTSTVTVNALPAAIGGGAAVCTSTSTTLTDASGTGTWSSSNTAVGSINAVSGSVTGISAGTTTITFTLTSTGCQITEVLTDNSSSGTISGLTSVCLGSTINLIDGASGGVWSSTGGTGSATAGSSSGSVMGTSVGSATINYTVPGCPAATYPITINALPGAVVGNAKVCSGSSTTLTDGGTGTWSSSNLAVATVVSGSGLVTGLLPGTASIIYTLTSTGCQASVAVTVNQTPVPIAGPSNVCPSNSGTNSSITLTDATMGGNWYTGSSVVSVSGGVVSGGASAGTATITYGFFSTGCYTTKVVNVYPAPSPIVGVTTFCQNTSVSLTDADAGTWSSTSPTKATVVATTGLVTGVAASSGDTILYNESDGCSAFVQITVLLAPVVNITASGPTTFCAGDSVTLTATGVGDAFQWFAGGSPIPGATSVTYTVLSTDPYTVEITNTSNCSTTSAATYVVAGLNPYITSSSPSASFCKGSNTVLTANADIAGTLTYQWADNGTEIPSATAATYYADMSGVYTCSVTVAGGSGVCLAVTPAYSVTVFPLPDPVINYNGVSFVTANYYRSYQWYLNLTAITGGTSYFWTPRANGSYNVVVTDSNGCTAYSTPYSYNSFVSGVASINTTGIEIFPNPATNSIHITSPVAVRAMITGIEGNVLIDQANAKDINTSSLANGLYMIILYGQDGERLMVQKLIKE